MQSERDEQEALFNYYFRDQELKYETKLTNLDTEATVPKWRIPYAAAIHPEARGGLSSTRGLGGRTGQIGRRRPDDARPRGASPLKIYDQAFNAGQDLANSYERRRIMGTDRALFPALRMRLASESWEGYCSGFTGSTIKHPEPIKPVDASRVGGASGVVFQPSDIKALLTCIYNRTTDDSYLFLAPPSARDEGPNMGTFHLALANYIGQAGHPIGIDRTKGRTSWNNPVYAYKINSIEDAGGDGDVRYKTLETTITYTNYGSDASRQTDLSTGARVGNPKQSMTCRYTLALDNEGRIVGGRALSSSGHFLWIPLYAVQGKEDGSVPGNPYVDVRKVIALARESSFSEIQQKFDAATIGPMIDPALGSPAD
ncbi:MAG: hypothetical protein H8E44_28810 [Planctomycetes bacterium]|nr:hypothetical protein [Planctomycetota bacterium]MBL7038573.1 hypothetical protein [Pirellulaceae bacterium]